MVHVAERNILMLLCRYGILVIGWLVMRNLDMLAYFPYLLKSGKF